MFYTTPLTLAIRDNDLDLMKKLVASGQNPRASNEIAMRVAAYHGNVEIVQYLESLGCDINANGQEPLISSVAFDHLPLVKYLLEEKKLSTELLDKDCNPDGLVGVAAFSGHYDIMVYLIESHNLDYLNASIVGYTISRNYLNCAQYLLEKIQAHYDMNKPDTQNIHIQIESFHIDHIIERDYVESLEFLKNNNFVFLVDYMQTALYKNSPKCLKFLASQDLKVDTHKVLGLANSTQNADLITRAMPYGLTLNDVKNFCLNKPSPFLFQWVLEHELSVKDKKQIVTKI